MNRELEQLEKALKGLKKPVLSRDLQSKMKANVLMQMANKEQLPVSLSRFGAAISKLASVVKMPAIAKARIRERILTHIGTRAPKASPFGFNFRWQRVLASVFVVVFVVSSATYYIADIPMTRAKAKLNKVTGSVEILRGQERIKAEENMDIEEGDTIITGHDGLVVIEYVDKGVTRLSPKTELIITKVEEVDNDKLKTEISVELTQGRVWTQVVNEEGDAEEIEIKVETQDIVASTSDSASFDIQQEEEGEKVQLSVYDNKVEVSIPEQEQEEEARKQFVEEGFTFEVEEQQPQISEIEEAIETIEDELWVKLNIVEDIEFIEGIQEVKMFHESAEETVVETDTAEIQVLEAEVDTVLMMTILPEELE